MSARRGAARFLGTPLQQAVLLSFVSRSLLGWLLALPLIGSVAASGLGALPEGDRALFQAPGYFSLELVAQHYRALGASLRVGVILWLIALILRTLPTALLFAVTASPGVTAEENAARAWRSVPRFLVIGAAELVAGALLFVVGSVAVDLAAARHHNEALAALGPLGVTLATGIAVLLVSVICDVTRLASLFNDLKTAVRAGLGLLRSRLLQLASANALFFGAGVLLVALAARVSEAVDVGRPGALRVAGVLLLHQAALFGLCALEALWLRRLAALART